MWPFSKLISPHSSRSNSAVVVPSSATFVALVLLFTTVGARRPLWWCLATAGIAGMAWSRTYLQVHWLLDVIAGSLLGVGVTLLVFAGLQVLLASPRS
jgi:undecaprenyl-diphosphatase